MPCTPPCFSMKPLTTVAISAPTTPPSNPSSKPMVNSVVPAGRSERVDQIDGLESIQFLQAGRRLGIVFDIVAQAQRELRGNLQRQHAKDKPRQSPFVVRPPRGVPAPRRHDAGTLSVQTAQMERMLPGSLDQRHVEGDIGRFRIRIAL